MDKLANSEKVKLGVKSFSQADGIGKSKYTISFHDGRKAHKDGSPFNDIRIFVNKVELNKFKQELISKEYVGV